MDGISFKSRPCIANPNSEGTKSFTLDDLAAFASSSWSENAPYPTVDIKTSIPVRAETKE